MCTDDKYFLCVLVSAVLMVSLSTFRLTCVAHLSAIASGMHGPHASRTEPLLKLVERFPALAYGTLIVVLAGWKGVQRYRDTRGSTSRSNGQWVLDIFIRQVISAGPIVSHTCLDAV